MSAGLFTFGEALVGLLADAPGPLAGASGFRTHVVGAELNVAIGVARLGHPAAFLGTVGSDAFGTATLRRLRAEGVNTDHVKVHPDAPTGILIRERHGFGPSEVLYYRRGSAGADLSTGDIESAEGSLLAADWVHVTGITPALSGSARGAVQRALELVLSCPVGQRPTLSIDVNLRRKLWTDDEASAVLRPLIAAVDVVFCSLEEARVIIRTGNVSGDPRDLARALLDLGAHQAVLKLGAAGALSLGPGDELIRRPALPVDRVVDPVGAGDAFCAGYIGARLDGRDVGSALDWGVTCGAAVVATDGDTTGFPTRPELDRLLQRGEDTLR